MGSEEQQYNSKNAIAQQLRELGDKSIDISHRIDPLSRPSILFDICVIKNCRTTQTGSIGAFQLLESGGLLLIHLMLKELLLFHFG
ncbi:MAG: hypothetical protein EZS28_045412 [Streblomastix strix]|uniref:Uncharacterized protein n=1 Tax=Streblomastix strix TaxID=222440 RepID=A0A5J4TNU3_9EUKA|nr:MAG: hypothetical protein EZS28_045412 [Streblomastix strix]